MLFVDAKNNNKFFIDIGLLALAICCIGSKNFAATNATKINGPGEVISQETIPIIEETTKGNWGVKIENAEWHDYVEYDDQGRLVDKHNIIIAKGEGGSGQGGGASGDGSKGADSSGTNGKGTSGNVSGKTAGQGGTSNNKNGGGGTSKNSVSSNAQKQQELAEEKARQAAAESRLNDMVTMQSLQESLYNKVLEEARKQSKTAPTVTEKLTDPNVVKNKPVNETQTIAYETDEVIKAPKSDINQLKDTTKRTTQPKVALEKMTLPDMVVPELPESIKSKTPDQELQDVPFNVPVITKGPSDQIDVSKVVDLEIVTQAETTKNTKNKVEPTAKNKDAPSDDLKEGDKGEKDHDDEDAAYKKELGDNKQDGKGDGQGGANNGVKIFELDRKGNLGLKATPGLNNIQGLIFAAIVGFLLIFGIFYYYAPYIFKSKKKKRSDFI